MPLTDATTVRPLDTLRQMIFGFRNTQAIYVVAKLGIPDLLRNEGPEKSDILAKRLGVHPRSLHRVMRGLASLGVFTQDTADRFGLTPIGEFLCTDVPGSRRHYAIMMGEEPYRVTGDMLETVRTGQTAFNRIYGMGHFEYLQTHPEANATFNAAMQGTRSSLNDLGNFYDFGRFLKVVDVGGNEGAVIATILNTNQQIHGILFDLPHVVNGAEGYLKSKGVLDRCQIIGGDAFDSVPPGGDLYVLSAVLHAFEDDKAKKILDNCRASIANYGTLLLIEQVLPEGDASSLGKMFDLIMLTVSGGMERTKSEWEILLRSSRFELKQVVETNFGTSLIEAQPI